MYVCMYVRTYVYTCYIHIIERERDRDREVYMYVCVYVYTYVYYIYIYYITSILPRQLRAVGCTHTHTHIANLVHAVFSSLEEVIIEIIIS
jgi:hypothetical protein